MNRQRRNNLAQLAQPASRVWSRGAGSLSASALLATAMLLLAFAPFTAEASTSQSLREWNARWAVLSSTLASSMGATDEATTRAQGEQLWRWMQSRAASFSNPQNISPQELARLLHQWQSEGRGTVQNPSLQTGAHFKPQWSSNDFSSSRWTKSTAQPVTLASVAKPTSESLPLASRRLATLSLFTHEAGLRAGVRTNRYHE